MAPTSCVMVGGEGPSSYRHNSTYQRALLEVAKEKIDEVISMKFDLNPDSNHLINVADFGCSTGPNTFIAVKNIIDAVEHKFHEPNPPNDNIAEFQVFFNDHSDNDFNTLLRTLPSDRRYMAACVPGSFYGRVLPRNSLHIGHCSNAIIWLSRVPQQVVDPDSPAWNKDSIHCTGFVKEVCEAYRDQFEADFRSFLDARAQELVHGGLLMLLGPCLPDGVRMSETIKGRLLDCVGSSLGDMAKLGLIDREKLGSFNIPLYIAQESEVKKVIEEDECFEMEVFERVSHEKEELPSDAKFLSSLFRAANEGNFQASFGKDAFEMAMERFEEKIEDFMADITKSGVQFFVLLRRK